MKRLIYFAGITGLIISLSACGNENGSESQKDSAGEEDKSKRQKTRLDHKPINPDTVELPLNNGQKWRLDSTTKNLMVRINQLIENRGRSLKEMNEQGFNQLGQKVNRQLEEIANQHDLEGQGKQALEKLLIKMKREADVMIQKDKKEAQVALLNLSELMVVYQAHFR